MLCIKLTNAQKGSAFMLNRDAFIHVHVQCSYVHVAMSIDVANKKVP